MGQDKKKLAVIFPGAGYSNDMPLLYYADLIYESKGYKCLRINYGGEGKSLSDSEKIKNEVLSQIENIDFSQYCDILFISKSLGTTFAGWLAERLSEKVRHIYLTPIQHTLQYIKGQDIQIVIAGTNDKYLDTSVLALHCKKEKIRLELIDNADHSLEIHGNASESIDILKRIVELYQLYC